MVEAKVRDVAEDTRPGAAAAMTLNAMVGFLSPLFPSSFDTAFCRFFYFSILFSFFLDSSVSCGPKFEGLFSPIYSLWFKTNLHDTQELELYS